VIVMENGIADADDDQRARHLVAHLRQAHRAMHEGVDLRGYIHWSLIDNYEWAEGFIKRFGLAAVDLQPRVVGCVRAAGSSQDCGEHRVSLSAVRAVGGR